MYILNSDMFGQSSPKSLYQFSLGVAEDETVGWHHWLSGHEYEQTLGGSEAQGSLARCGLWSRRKLDLAQRLNNFHYLRLHDHY